MDSGEAGCLRSSLGVPPGCGVGRGSGGQRKGRREFQGSMRDKQERLWSVVGRGVPEPTGLSHWVD